MFYIGLLTHGLAFLYICYMFRLLGVCDIFYSKPNLLKHYQWTIVLMLVNSVVNAYFFSLWFLWFPCLVLILVVGGLINFGLDEIKYRRRRKIERS